MKLKEQIDNLYITLKNLLKSPVTVQYPKQKRKIPERFRGIFALTTNPQTNEENCIGCRLCESICPSHVITVIPEKKEGRTWAKEFYLDMGPCIFCELCVQVCPTDAIVMVKTNEVAYRSREEMILDKKRLLENEKKYPLSWTRGTNLREMQAPMKVELEKGHD